MNRNSLLRRVINKIVRYVFRERTALRLGKELFLDGESLNIINPSYGDWFVHPCVRYIEKGFAGHKWWMVVTPYPNGNSKYENPVLYYGEGETEEPPINWTMVGIVQDTHPEGGYNADGNIIYLDGKLWIIWKENDTCNTRKESGYRVIMGCYYDGVSFSKPQIFAHNPDDKSMYLASPVLYETADGLKMLGVYSPVMGDNIPGKEKKPRSIAVFSIKDNNIQNIPFTFDFIAQLNYYNGFDFWHIDCFEGKMNHYCLVTPESGTEILLGESSDGMTYSFFKKPLLHANGRDRVTYMYKPSGVLIGNRFHLFYPHRIKGNRVHIFCTSTDFQKLIQKISK